MHELSYKKGTTYFNLINLQSLSKRSIYMKGSNNPTVTLLLFLTVSILIGTGNCTCNVANCQDCDPLNQSYCINCIWPYVLSSGICCHSSLLQCTSCWGNSSYCAACNSLSFNEQYIVSYSPSRWVWVCSICIDYIPYCRRCYSRTSCIACSNTLYGLQNVGWGSVCSPCAQLIQNCLTCLSKSVCLTCRSYFIFSPNQTDRCSLCASFMTGCLDCKNISNCQECSYGKIVKGGCSKVIGCVQVVQNRALNESPCILCNSSDFHDRPVKQTCLCKQGHLAGQFCTTIVGCEKIISFNGPCYACSIYNKFILVNGTCECLKYHERKGQICRQICGDGRHFDLPCDDGNLIDGDGCSSTCQNEDHYECKRGNSTYPSKCVYKGVVQIVLVSMEKIEDQNRVKITLTTSPQVDNFAKMNLAGILSFSTLVNCNVSSFEVVGPNLYLYVDFYQDIEGKKSSLRVSFDKTVIDSFPADISLTFKDSEGVSLLYDIDSTAKDKTMRYAIRILGLIAIGVFFLGSFTHKMIGVQTIHTFQTTIIILGLSQNFYPYMANYAQLNFVMGTIHGTKSTIEWPSYKNLGYSQEFTSNYLVLAGVQLSSLALFLLTIFLLFLIKDKECLSKILERCLPFLERAKKIIYDFLVFPLFIGFLYHYALTMGIACRHRPEQKDSSYLERFATVAVTIATIYVVSSEFTNFLFPNTSNQSLNGTNKQIYVPLFLAFTYISALLFEFIMIFTYSSIIIFILGGQIFLFTALAVFLRPYNNNFHNFSLILNQLTVTFALFWHSFLYYRGQNCHFQDKLLYALFGCLSTVLLCALIRIIIECKSKANNEQSPNTQAKKISQLIHENPLNQAILKEGEQINSYRLQSQRQRDLKEVKTISHYAQAHEGKEYMQKYKRKKKSYLRKIMPASFFGKDWLNLKRNSDACDQSQVNTNRNWRTKQ